MSEFGPILKVASPWLREAPRQFGRALSRWQFGRAWAVVVMVLQLLLALTRLASAIAANRLQARAGQLSNKVRSFIHGRI